MDNSKQPKDKKGPMAKLFILNSKLKSQVDDL